MKKIIFILILFSCDEVLTTKKVDPAILGLFNEYSVKMWGSGIDPTQDRNYIIKFDTIDSNLAGTIFVVGGFCQRGEVNFIQINPESRDIKKALWHECAHCFFDFTEAEVYRMFNDNYEDNLISAIHNQGSIGGN